MSDTETPPSLAPGITGSFKVASLAKIGRVAREFSSMAPYGLAAMGPMMIVGGPGSALSTIVISAHTLMLAGLVVFVLWLFYKVLTSVIYAVVALVVVGAILLQLHVIPASDVPFKIAPIWSAAWW
jgi:hypothetical protein